LILEIYAWKNVPIAEGSLCAGGEVSKVPDGLVNGRRFVGSFYKFTIYFRGLRE
jgi:hypothetical protein